jgi:hypothetical protein
MSHKNHSIRIKGFSCDGDFCSELDQILNEKREDWSDGLEAKEIAKNEKALARIRALASGEKIGSCFADAVTAGEPLAVGWIYESDFKDVTQKTLNALEVILNDLGLTVKPVENDEFETYG